MTARQLSAFALVEVGTFVLNAVAFHVLVTLCAASYLVARCTGTLAVYLAFSFPLWARVFRPATEDAVGGARPPAPRRRLTTVGRT